MAQIRADALDSAWIKPTTRAEFQSYGNGWECRQRIIMKVKIASKARPQRSGPANKLATRRKSDSLTITGLKNAAKNDRECVQLFKKAVKGRPKDVSWLLKFGQLGRCIGLNFDETSSVIRSHYKKLKGNTRRSWIERGLKMGYSGMGLTA